MNISVINNFSSKRRLQEALLFVQRCSLYRMFPVNKFLRIFPPIKHFCLLISPLAVRRNTATSCHYKPRTGRNGQLISMPLQQHGQQIKSMLLQKWSNLGYYAATSRSRCIDICSCPLQLTVLFQLHIELSLVVLSHWLHKSKLQSHDSCFTASNTFIGP